MKNYKYAILTLLSPLMISSLASCDKNDLSMPQAQLDKSILTWEETTNAINYEIRISQNNQPIKSIYKQKEDDRKINLDECQIPFGLTTVEVIAHSKKYQRSTSFQYVESTIRNLFVNENSYTRVNPIEGHTIASYHQGIEFVLGTTLNIKEIVGKEITGTSEEQMATYNSIKELYNSFLSATGETKKQLAGQIGDDLIVSYYYIKNNQPTHFYTKQKYWAQFLNYKQEDGTFAYFGQPSGYFNTAITPNVYRTAVNFSPLKIDFAPLSDNMLYTEVTVIKNGQYASRTTSVRIDPVVVQSFKKI